MKIVAALMLMLALGLSTVYGQEWENDDVMDPKSYDVNDFMTHLLNADDDDEDDDEIVDMDDALQKYRMLKSISRIVAEAESQDLMNPNKRFIGSFFGKIKDALKKAVSKVGDFFKKTWNKAKEAFSKITKAIPFDVVVKKLIPFIHSGMSVAACKKALAAGATAILGPAAGLVANVAAPVCDAALAKIQEVAG